MTVEPLVPDMPAAAPETTDPSGFLQALDALGGVFARADRAEAAFTNGHGGLQEMVVSRAHADIAVAIATAAASRAAQALSQILGMQI